MPLINPVYYTPADLANIDNVTLTTPANGEFLKFDGTEWINAAVPGGISTLAALTDTTIVTPSTGQFLKFNGSAWVNETQAVPSDLEDLVNVTVTAPSLGQVLKYDGSGWINDTDGGVALTNTDDLSEGITNLYYTDARADARVALLVDAAPATLDTLNELAAALGDDPNFASTVSSAIGLNTTHKSSDGSDHTFINQDVTTTGDVTFNSLDASSITVGSTNLDQLYNSRDRLNGSFKEHFNCYVINDATSVRATLQSTTAGDLTCRWSGNEDAILDCTPILEVTLTPGTATTPQANYVYVLESTRQLTASTTGWPTTEHIKVTYTLVANVGGEQAFINQNWNDGDIEGNGMGHTSGMAQWVRAQGATYFSGINPIGATGFITISGAGAGPIYWKSSAGHVAQLHGHTFTAKDTDPAGNNDDLHVINHFTTPYLEIHDIGSLTADSTGTAFKEYYNLVIWAVANKGGTYDPLMINLPSGSYANSSDAIADVSSFDDYSIPREYSLDSGTGFLIARITLRYKTGTFYHINTNDLRGLKGIALGGSAGSGGTALTNFADSLFYIYDTLDDTKKVEFFLDGISTATTRTITVPDTDVDLTDITTNNAKVSADAQATNQGNTFNGNNQLVQLNGTGQLPAVDGSLLTGISGGSSVTTSDTAPLTPSDGDLWWDSVNGILKIYYHDGTSGQWVQASPMGITALYTTTLPTTGWTGSVAPFSYAATVTGVVSTDEPFIDLDLSSSTYANIASIQTAYSKVYRAVASANTVTFYADAVPTIAVPLKLKVVA